MTGSAPMSVENEVDMIALPVIGSTDLLGRRFLFRSNSHWLWWQLRGRLSRRLSLRPDERLRLAA